MRLSYAAKRPDLQILQIRPLRQYFLVLRTTMRYRTTSDYGAPVNRFRQALNEEEEHRECIRTALTDLTMAG
jgi:hypothetical protein